jgi:hypothetical protein
VGRRAPTLATSAGGRRGTVGGGLETPTGGIGLADGARATSAVGGGGSTTAGGGCTCAPAPAGRAEEALSPKLSAAPGLAPRSPKNTATAPAPSTPDAQITAERGAPIPLVRPVTMLACSVGASSSASLRAAGGLEPSALAEPLGDLPAELRVVRPKASAKASICSKHESNRCAASNAQARANQVSNSGPIAQPSALGASVAPRPTATKSFIRSP